MPRHACDCEHDCVHFRIDLNWITPEKMRAGGFLGDLQLSGPLPLIDVSLKKKDTLAFRLRGALILRQADRDITEAPEDLLTGHEVKMVDISEATFPQMASLCHLFQPESGYYDGWTEDQKNKKQCVIVKYSDREYVLSWGTMRQMGLLLDRFLCARILKHKDYARFIGR